jgi:hypothetical protein
MKKVELTQRNERLSTIARNSQANLFRLFSLRGQLEREIRGVKGHSPTAYIRIKREFGITGSRKNVLRQLGEIIYEKINALDNSE